MEEEARAQWHQKDECALEGKLSDSDVEIEKTMEDVSKMKHMLFVSGELYDPRTLGEASEREMKELQSEFKTKDKELMKLTDEVGVTSEERDRLKESKKTIESTLDFTKDHQLKTLETEHREELESTLKNAAAKFEESERNKEQLLAQLHQETSQKEQQMLHARSTIESLRGQIKTSEEKAAQMLNTVKDLERSLAEQSSDMDKLKRSESMKKEAMARVTHLEEALQVKEQEQECLQNQLVEVHEELVNACKELEQMAQQHGTQQGTIENLQIELDSRDSEIQKLQNESRLKLAQLKEKLRSKDDDRIAKNLELLLKTEHCNQLSKLLMSKDKQVAQLEAQIHNKRRRNTHKGRHRQFTSKDDLAEKAEKAKREQEWRKMKGIESDEEEEGKGDKKGAKAKPVEAASKLSDDEEEEETDSDEEDVVEKVKGVSHLIETKNPNREKSADKVPNIKMKKCSQCRTWIHGLKCKFICTKCIKKINAGKNKRNVRTSGKN